MTTLKVLTPAAAPLSVIEARMGYPLIHRRRHCFVRLCRGHLISEKVLEITDLPGRGRDGSF